MNISRFINVSIYQVVLVRNLKKKRRKKNRHAECNQRSIYLYRCSDFDVVVVTDVSLACD